MQNPNEQRPDQPDQDHEEELIDEAIEESFPASDPPSPAHVD